MSSVRPSPGLGAKAASCERAQGEAQGGGGRARERGNVAESDAAERAGFLAC